MLGRKDRACALGHLAAGCKQDKSGALTLMVCALDQARMGSTGALASRELAAAAVAESARGGVDGQALAAYSPGCPNHPGVDCLFDDYLLGKDRPR